MFKLSQWKRFLIFGLAALFAAPPMSYGAIDSIFPSSYFFTLNPRVEPNGPVFSGDEEAYVKDIFRRLVFHADLLARDAFYNPEDAEKGFNYTYYTFMALALAVPFHESRLNHLRTNQGENCVQDVNDFSRFGKYERAQRILRKSLQPDGKDPAVPDCQYFGQTEQVTQALVSGSNDLGIMQLNVSAHPSAARPELYFDVDSFLDYGLRYLFDGNGYRGFVAIRDKSNKELFPCLWSKGRLNFENLVRGTWARYNSGSNVCRFANPDSGHSSKDDEFENNLREITRGPKGRSYFQWYLPVGSIEREAFDELTANFRGIQKHHSEENTALFRMIEEERTRWQARQSEEVRHPFEPTHTVDALRLNARALPGLKTAVCGALGREVGVETVEIKRRVGMVDGFEWMEVEPPLSSSFFGKANKDCRGKRSFFVASKYVSQRFGVEGRSGWIDARTAVIYSAATEYSKPVAVVEADRHIRVLESVSLNVGRGEWHKVRLDKITGWIKGDALHVD